MVRSLARARAAEVPVVPARAIVRDYSRPASTAFSVEFDVRTAYDFVFSLSDDAGSTDDLPAPDRAWLSEAKASLRAQAGAALEVYGTELCVVLAGLAVDRPDVHDAADLAALVATLDDEAIVRAIAADDLRDADRRENMERAIAGDEAAIDQLLARLTDHYPPEQHERWARDLPGSALDHHTGPHGPRAVAPPVPADRGSGAGDDQARCGCPGRRHRHASPD